MFQNSVTENMLVSQQQREVYVTVTQNQQKGSVYLFVKSYLEIWTTVISTSKSHLMVSTIMEVPAVKALVARMEKLRMSSYSVTQANLRVHSFVIAVGIWGPFLKEVTSRLGPHFFM